MTAQDFADIQEQLECSLPTDYIEFMLSDAPKVESLFNDQTQILEENFNIRKECWRGNPLDRFFFVFGRDKEQRMLILDLDFPGGAVLRQDESSPDPSIRSKFLSPSFKQWKDGQKPEMATPNQPPD